MRKTFVPIVLASIASLSLALLAAPALAKTKPPAIKSVKFNGTPAEPQVVVKGTGLGAQPFPEPTPNCFEEEPIGLGNDYGTSAVLTDSNAGWSAGEGLGDCIGLIFQTFTETEVVFELGSAYHEYVPLHKGDSYTLTINELEISGSVKIKEPKAKKGK